MTFLLPLAWNAGGNFLTKICANFNADVIYEQARSPGEVPELMNQGRFLTNIPDQEGGWQTPAKASEEGERILAA